LLRKAEWDADIDFLPEAAAGGAVPVDRHSPTAKAMNATTASVPPSASSELQPGL